MQIRLSLILVALLASYSWEDGPAMRTWTDAAGKFRVKAAFVECEDYRVTLDTGDRKLTLPFTRLSADDQLAVRDILRLREKIPDDIVKVLDAFEKKRQAKLGAIGERETEAAVRAARAAHDKELEMFRFHQENPILGEFAGRDRGRSSCGGRPG